MSVDFIAGDKLRVISVASAANAVQVSVRGRFDNKQPLNLLGQHTPTNDRLTAATDVSTPLTQGGTITSAAATVAAGTKRGQVYVGLYVVDATNRIRGGLFRGYVYDSHELSLGEFIEPGPGGGEGNIRTVTGTDPGSSGEEISEAVPTNAIWRLLSFSAVLVTGSDAATRNAQLVIDDGAAANRREYHVGQDQTASLTRTHLWHRGGTNPNTLETRSFVDTDTVLSNPSLRDNIFLPEAYRIRTLTVAIDVTGPSFDNWSAPIFQVEEWLVI